MNCRYWRAALLACGLLAMTAFSMESQAREATRSTTVRGIRVSFAVMPVGAFDAEHAPGTARADADAAPHRIVVQLTERKSGRHVSDAEVDVFITSGEYASGPLRMQRAVGGGRIYFETTLPHLPRAALYQVDFRLAGSTAVSSVHFDYRHGQ